MNFEVAPKSTELMANWHNAILYCSFLEYNGYTDWRLPTKEELAEIYNSENDFKKCAHWSSTENNGNSAWCQGFINGSQYSFDKKYGGYYVRAVRDI